MGYGAIQKASATDLIIMFHKAVSLRFCEGTVLEMAFQDGSIKQYDISSLFAKYPQLEALRDRSLFTSGKLMGAYGIFWNDDLDLEAETVYEDGTTISIQAPAPNVMVADAVLAARARAGITQAELSLLTGIDQSDISKIERGVANPSVSTLSRIAKALGAELSVSIA